MASIKRADGHISRDWDVIKKHAGLYSGGKIDMFSPNGQDVLACLYSEDISFVDVSSGQVITTLQGGEDNNEQKAESYRDEEELAREVITNFCLNKKNGLELVTTSRSMIIRHWSINNLNNSSSSYTIKCIRTLKGHTEPILSMDYDSSGIFVATGSADHTARIWDMRGGYATHNFRNHGGIVSLVKFHPDVRKLLLITACDDCLTRIWSLHDKTCIATLNNHMSVVTCIAFSYDGNTMVTGSRDKVINFWELRRNTLMKTLPVYEEIEGLCIVHGNEDDNNNNKKEEEEEDDGDGGKNGKGKDKKRKHSVVIEDAKGTLIVIGSKGIARSWNYEAKDHMELSAKSRQGGRDDLLRCTENSSKQISKSQVPSPYTSLIYVNNSLKKKKNTNIEDNNDDDCDNYLNKEFLICATADHNISFIDPYNLETNRRIVGYFDEVNTVKYIPNPTNQISQNKIAIATNSEQLKILKINDFSCDIYEGHQGTIISLDVSPNGKYIITGSKDRTARVWYIDDQEDENDKDDDDDAPSKTPSKCVLLCVGHTSSVTACALSQKLKSYETNDSFFFTGSGDKTIKKWKLDERKFNNLIPAAGGGATSADGLDGVLKPHAVGNIRAHEKDINHLCVAPNDTMVVSASQDKTARIWSVSDLSLIGTLKGHKRGIMQTCFSPANKSIATASGDRTIKIWSLKDYTCLNTLQGHSGSVCQISYLNAYGLQLVSTGSDGLLKIWTIKTGECENTYDAHDDKVWGLSVSQDHQTLVTGGADSLVKVWKDVTTAKEEALILESESRILKEQDLMYSLHSKDYTQAIELAFDLDHSYKLWNIFNEIIEQQQEEQQKETEDENNKDTKKSLTKMEEIIIKFDDERILKCLEYVREWNTNATKSLVAQIILSTILNIISFQRLKKIYGLLDIINSILPYTERHFNRIDRLSQASFLIDYSCTVMSSIQQGGEFGKVTNKNDC